MFNVINGGRHAEDSTDIQEFMVIPAGFPTFSQALRAGAEVYQALKGLLREEGMSTALGDEGGFAPSVSSNCEAVQLLVAAVERAGYVPGDHCFIGLDVAASELRLDNGLYALRREATTMSSDKLIELYETWTDEYPIVSVEDGIEEEDWVGWRTMTARLGNSLQLVGDDVFATNAARIRQGIGLDAGNAVLIKPNQIGTLTETLEVVTIAKEAGWGTVISHPFGRDRRHIYRRPVGRHLGWPNQGGRPGSRRAYGQIQPSAAYRRGVGRGSGVRGAGGLRTFAAA